MRAQESRFNDKRLEEAVKLLKGSDSVELKLTIPDASRASTIEALNLDILDAEMRDVIFFDTPDLRLNRAGIVARARRMRKGGDSVIKLRPVIPDSLPNRLRRSKSFNIEVDWMPGRYVCSGSFKAKADNAEVWEVLKEGRAIRKLFLPEQRAFFEKHAPKGVTLDSLVPLGPVHVAKLKYAAPHLKGRPAVAEMWFYPDGSRTLELSTKCTPDEAFQVLAETRAALTENGIPLTGEQETKTRKALEFFSRQYAAKSKAA
jgi:hypothetical protein